MPSAYGSSNDVEIGYNAGSSTSWSNVTNTQTVGTYINSVSATNFKVRSDSNGGVGTYFNSRVFLYFDTSFIPDNALITDANLNVFMETNTSGGSIQPIYAVVGTFPAAALSTSNYGDLNKSLVYGSGNIGTNNNNNTINFSTQGLTLINKTGNTKIVLITNNDYTGSIPSSGSTERSKTLSSQNNATIGQRPLLTVNWTLSTPFSSYIT